MKKNYSTFRKVLFAFILILLNMTPGLNAQVVTYTFTTCGGTGNIGPTQTQITSAYANTTTSLTAATTAISGIQTFTCPTSGLYKIDASGASGGNTTTNARVGGMGVRTIGEYNLNAGDVLKIIVGQVGPTGCGMGGGGGGSFVQRNTTILHAAGGGGGASSDNNGADASILTSGTTDNPFVSQGGTNGSGGLTCQTSVNNGGGGGGYLTDGQSNVSGGYGGSAFVNGGMGGISIATANPVGGFGGGGSGTNCTVGGGGGGGYSGGAGGQQVGYCNSGVNRSGGGGGGSWNTGANQSNNVLSIAGDGKVIITSLCNISLVSTANPICIGSTIVLSTNAASGILWSNSTNGSSITVTPNVTTTYSVTGTSTANCNASSAITVTVNPLPVLSAVVSPTTLCVGQTGTIAASGAFTYTWSSGPSGVTTTVNPASTTVYTYIGTTIYGCVNSNTVAVNVNSNSLTITPNSMLCKGSTMNLTASGAVTYTWTNGSLFSTTPVTPSVSTTYTVRAMDIYNCLLSNIVSVTVNDLPLVVATANKTLVCKGDNVVITGSGADTYTWSTGFVGASLSTTLPVDIPYYFSVTGADLLGCKKTVNITIMVSKCLGVNEMNNSELLINVLPNPGSGLFNVQVEKVTDQLNMKVYNELGMLVKTQDIVSTESKLDLQNEKNGIYFVRIGDKDNVLKVIKLIKE